MERLVIIGSMLAMDVLGDNWEYVDNGEVV